MTTPPRPRLLALVAPFAAGVLLGIVGVGVISLTATIGGVTVPWGLVLAVLGVGVSARGAAWLVGSRRAATAVLLGWLVPTLAFSALNPGGDVILTDEPATYVYLLGAFALALAAAAWPLPSGAWELAHPDPEVFALDDELLAPVAAGDAADEPVDRPADGRDGAAQHDAPPRAD